jgi:hypothetical protein
MTTPHSERRARGPDRQPVPHGPYGKHDAADHQEQSDAAGAGGVVCFGDVDAHDADCQRHSDEGSRLNSVVTVFDGRDLISRHCGRIRAQSPQRIVSSR